MRPAAKSTHWAKWTVIMALLGWLVLTIVSYLSLPMFQAIWWFSKLVTAAAWIWAALWSFTAMMAYLSLKVHVRSFAVMVIMVFLGAVIFRIDWQTLYIDSQFWLHRDEFAALVAENASGRPLTVPWWMEYLSIDGQVRQQGEVLYLPVFEDSWRSESGSGIAHLPAPPTSRTIVQTAAGDLGTPVRELGNGWWWVE
ncbi:hypothetical protein HTZ77_40295 [Nonomuraea sp. SMC257]|uniref:Uncharacterized protein n=1 Tax=Nonomuraea montanisoli TaxID=2741721 RepID=A0A7Y6IG99_9ACTN|nr:hypothetical protein [Nonomuraea montanisoli]NUW37601.1 hypothetical protein [Nonomuraea montanisoli]